MADYTDNAFIDSASVPPFPIGPAPDQDAPDSAVATFISHVPFDGDIVQYLNRCYDSVAGKFVYWITPTVDTTGAYYPGPGVFGVTATDRVFSVLG